MKLTDLVVSRTADSTELERPVQADSDRSFREFLITQSSELDHPRAQRRVAASETPHLPSINIVRKSNHAHFPPLRWQSARARMRAGLGGGLKDWKGWPQFLRGTLDISR